MGNFLTTNQWNLIIISMAATVFAGLLGMLLVKQAYEHWYWVFLYIAFYFVYIVLFYKAFSV